MTVHGDKWGQIVKKPLFIKGFNTFSFVPLFVPKGTKSYKCPIYGYYQSGTKFVPFFFFHLSDKKQGYGETSGRILGLAIGTI